ncbi:hypothetical protein KVP10_12065 [Candidimonas humi]|uniref:YjbR protein n=1 Tax=Candidimonas humi TaxID=683355 RepID=A0ABV8P0I2_9BURK|nr:hypothetical protein [Candidimonas humi]MBV6305627.1 hypothetical protein [Candidimonas humi]
MPSRFDPYAPAGKKRASARHSSLLWILEPLEQVGDYATRKMFGCDAAYLGGLLCLVVADRDDPWNGLLVCTAQEHHKSLMDELPGLQPHPVLGKWLYVPQGHEEFETLASRITRLVLARDPRIGVEPKPRSRRRIKQPEG